MIESKTVSCPHCATMLVFEGLSQGQVLICPRCRGRFDLTTGPLPFVHTEPPDDEGPVPAKVARMVLPVGRSGWAIAAGYLGLFSLLPIIGLFSLAIGVFALRDIKRNPHKHGKGRAIFAIVMGLITSLCYLTPAIFWILKG